MKGNATEMAVYKVEKTGYYCVALIPTGKDSKFEAWVEWRYPYGELPAGDYPKLLVSINFIFVHPRSHVFFFNSQLYGAFACVYTAVGIFWAIQSYRNWDDILPVQVKFYKEKKRERERKKTEIRYLALFVWCYFLSYCRNGF